MPQLRKAIPTKLGLPADLWRMEALTLRRAGKVVVEVGGFLTGANPNGGTEPVISYTDTLPAASALLVRAAPKAQMETVALTEWGKMREEFAGATMEP